MRVTLTFFILCLSSLLQAQTTIQIAGPAEVPPGDLVVLSVQTTAQEVQWFLGNSDKTFLPVENGRKIVFASGLPGRYRFHAVAFSARLEGEDIVTESASAVHVLTITGPVPPTPTPPGPQPPPGPNPPVPPGPTPGPVIPEGLAREIYDATMRVQSANRRAEAQAFAAIFQSVASKAAGLSWSPAEMQGETSRQMKATGTVYDTWKPLRDQLTISLKALALSPDDRDGHIRAWQTIAAALGAVQ